MKSLFFSLFIILLTYPAVLSAQQTTVAPFQRIQLSALSTNGSNGFLQQTTEPKEDNPFITLAFKCSSLSQSPLLFRYKDAEQWSDWETIIEDNHNKHSHLAISKLYFLPSTTNTIQINSNTHSFLPTDEMHIFYPRHSQASDLLVRGTQGSNGCPCPQPSFKGRDQWCQIDNCPIDATPIFTDVSHLIVHHSATANASNDWPAVVHSFWNYHVNTNGWDDIGYNWLIDPNGVIYEGRGDNIQGAHFCGLNPNTMGICVIGNFETDDPSEKAMKSLKRLFAWKSCQEDLDPTAISYHPPSDEEIFVVSGHRDGCQTACPGEFLYDLLPELRDYIDLEIDSSCGSILPPVSLTASELSSGVIELNWTDQSDNETVFVIERKTADSDYFYPLNTSPSNTTSFVDNSQLLDEALEYRVLAANEQDTSIYSNTASLMTTETNEIALESPFLSLSPSPFNNQLIIENKSKSLLELKVYDIKGNLILEKQLQPHQLLNIVTTEWQKGLYMVQSTDQSTNQTIKIIKQ